MELAERRKLSQEGLKAKWSQVDVRREWRRSKRVREKKANVGCKCMSCICRALGVWGGLFRLKAQNSEVLRLKASHVRRDAAHRATLQQFAGGR